MHAAFTSNSQVNPVWNAVLGCLGGAAGGTAGYFVTGWLLKSTLYTPILPGVLLGLGCGGFIRRRSIPLAALCGIAALGLGVFTEWSYFPFAKDDSLGFFVEHVLELPRAKLLLIAVGAVGGFWFALGSPSKALRPPAEAPADRDKPSQA